MVSGRWMMDGAPTRHHQSGPPTPASASTYSSEAPAQKGQAFGGLYSYELTMARLCMERSYHQ